MARVLRRPHRPPPWRALAALGLALLATAAGAVLPEPDHVIYGTVSVEGAPAQAGTVSVVVGSAGVLATYELAPDPAAPGRYVLRVPMDALDPRRPGAARPGEAAEILYEGQVAGLATIGAPGTTQSLDLDPAFGLLVDLDDDGLTGAEEAALGTDPTTPDTDGDGLPDAYEAAHGLDPLDPADAGQDADADGLTNLQELGLGTDPNRPEVAAAGISTPRGTPGHTTVEVSGLDGEGAYGYGVPEGPLHGSATVDAQGRVTFIPEPFFVGSDGMAVEGVDSHGTAASAWVEIEVTSAPLPYGVPTVEDLDSLDDAARPAGVALGDVDGDGDVDAVVADAGGGKVLVYSGRAGVMALGAALDVGGTPGPPALADMDGDGRPDLVLLSGAPGGAARLAALASGNLVTVRLNGPSGFGAGVPYPLGASPVAVDAGDLDGDGATDLLLGTRAPDGVSVLLGDGAGGFAATVAAGACADPAGVRLADLDGDGDLDAAAACRGSGSVEVLLNAGDGTLGPAASYPAGGAPGALAVGDVDGDGRPDLVTASAETRQVSVLPGGPAGTFGAPVRFTVPGSPAGLALTDLDGDGDLDAVVCLPEEGLLVTLLGEAGGMFGRVWFEEQPGHPTGLAVADLDHDGQGDLFITDPQAGTVSVLRTSLDSDGDGLPDAYERSAGLDPQDPDDASGDADDDGLSNLAEHQGGTAPTSADTDSDGIDDGAEVGAGLDPVNPADAGEDADDDGLSNAEELASGTDLRDPDTDGDGIPDGYEVAEGLDPLKPANGAEDADGDGLSNAEEYGQGTDPMTPETAAGRIEVAQGRSGSTMVTLAGSTGPSPVFAVSGPPGSGLAVVSRAGEVTYLPEARFQGSDSLEVRVTDGAGVVTRVTVPVDVGPGDAGAEPPGVETLTSLLEAGSPAKVVMADLDRDGDPDLAVGDLSGRVYVYLGDGAGGFGFSKVFEIHTVPAAMAQGDLDGDGAGDLVVVGPSTDAPVAGRTAERTPDDFGRVVVLVNEGTGEFRSLPSYLAGDTPSTVALGDVDGDGNLDAVVGNLASDEVTVHLGDGTGALRLASSAGVGQGPVGVALEDLDGDGDLDLAVCNSGSRDVTVLVGAGDGTFATLVTVDLGSVPSGVTTGDLDGNGIPDLVVASGEGGEVSVLFGKGNGTFQEPVRYSVGGSPAEVQVADLVGNGIADLVISDGQGRVVLLVGDGDGFFETVVMEQVGGAPGSLAVGDLDRDRVQDLVTTDAEEGSVRVFRVAAESAAPPEPEASGGGGGGCLIQTLHL